MEMQGIQSIIRLKLTTCRRFGVCAALWLALSAIHISNAQNMPPTDPILQLHDGILLVRFPAYTAKIDTLQSLIKRASDGTAKKRFEKLLQETTAMRDTLLQNYTKAFLANYTFSKTAYFFDYDARNLDRASYYTMDGQRISIADFHNMPIFYLNFERTEESKIDAMVIYDGQYKKISAPFPNNFTQGGFNIIIVKIADKKFPDWRVKKMNKRLWKYYNDVRMDNFVEETK